MRCRNLPAASSSPGLWITDDVLSEAFNRFVRVSNANLYHAKRFRSHAPGPLEARRRATRRKMGVATVASGAAPPPFDMGALFGLGVRPGADMEKGMRWESPGTSASPPTWQVWDQKWRKRPSSKRADEERLAQFLEIPKDPVETSRAGFEELLSARQDAELLETGDMEPLLAYLQSAENVPDAHLTERLLSWLQGRQVSDQSLLALVNVTDQKLALGTISDAEMDSVTQKLSKRKIRNVLAVSFATRLPQTWAQKILAKHTRRILDSEDASTRLERLRQWLVCIDSSTAMGQRHNCLDARWTDVYAEIAKHFVPSDLAEHFSTLPHHAMSWIILRHWVPLLVKPSTSSTPDFTDLHVSRRMRNYDETIDLPPHGLLERDLKRLNKISRDGCDPDKARSPLGNLVQVLAERRLPHTAIIEEIISIFRQSGPAKTVRNIFLDILERSTVGVPTPLATSLAKHFMASGEIEHARQIFEAVPTIPLSACFDLPLLLVEKRALPSWLVFILLTRLTPQDTLSANQRGVHTSSLNQEHIDLVHLVAHACAKSPHISPRVAFRRVWECYRFLRDRNAPLDILMSRALVKAGISRYLAEGVRPSAKQVAYILNVVRRIEGQDVAKTLDVEVYRLGRRLWREKPGDSPPRWNLASVERDEADVQKHGEVRHRVERTQSWTTGRTRSVSRTVGRAERAKEIQEFNATGFVTAHAMDDIPSAKSDLVLAEINEPLSYKPSMVEQGSILSAPTWPKAGGADVDAKMTCILEISETVHNDQKASGIVPERGSRQEDDMQPNVHVHRMHEGTGEPMFDFCKTQSSDPGATNLLQDTVSVAYKPPSGMPTLSSNTKPTPAAPSANEVEILDRTEFWSIAPRIASLAGEYNSFLIKGGQDHDVYIPIRESDPLEHSRHALMTQCAGESSAANDEPPRQPSFQSVVDLLTNTSAQASQQSDMRAVGGVDSEAATIKSDDFPDEDIDLDAAEDADLTSVGESATLTAQRNDPENAGAQSADLLSRRKQARWSYLRAQQKATPPVGATGRYARRARFRKGLAGVGER